MRPDKNVPLRDGNVKCILTHFDTTNISETKKGLPCSEHETFIKVENMWQENLFAKEKTIFIKIQSGNVLQSKKLFLKREIRHYNSNTMLTPRSCRENTCMRLKVLFSQYFAQGLKAKSKWSSVLAQLAIILTHILKLYRDYNFQQAT